MRKLLIALLLLAGCSADCDPVPDAEASRRRRGGGEYVGAGNPDSSPLDPDADMLLALGGQSNALGNSGGQDAALSTDAGYNNVRYDASSVSPLNESNSLESPASGILNQITYLSSDGARQGGVFRWAVGATAIQDMDQGDAPYTSAQTTQTNLWSAYATDRATRARCAWFAAFEGETNSQNGDSASTYATRLTTWGLNWYTDTVATGKTWCPYAPYVMYAQRANYTVGNGGTRGNGPVSAGEYDAHEADPTHYTLSHPTYPIRFSTDGLHKDGHGHRTSGAYMGKAAHHGFVSGAIWHPLEPASITCTANVITMTVQGGVGSTNLVEDTTTVVAKDALGFSYDETTPQADLPVVVSAACAGGRTCTITLDRNCESDGYLEYGYRAQAMGLQGPTNPGAAGGNVRNQDTTVPWYDGAATLPDWLVIFRRPIDTCTNCTASAAWTFAFTDSFLADNSPVTYLSGGSHLTDLDGARDWSYCWWGQGSGANAWDSGPTVHMSQHAASHRQLDIRGTGNEAEQVFVSSSLSSISEYWVGATNSMQTCGNAWCMVCVTYDGDGATNDDKFSFYRCSGGTCTDLTSGGTFTGTFPATLTTGGSADFSLGAASIGAQAAPGAVGNEHEIGMASWWNVTLTSGNVDSLYGAGTPVDPRTVGSGPLHLWHLQNNGADVGSGTSFPLRKYGTATGWNTNNP